MPPEAIDRFRAKYEIDPETECWLWTAALKENGYGVFGRGGRTAGTAYAHRWSFEYFRGPIPDGFLVCHRCDVRHCVNPDHMFLGTSGDNQADMVVKGRSLRGERHNRVKLNEQDVLELRRLYAETKLTQTALARRYGVSKATVSDIVRGDSWGHLLPADWAPPPPRRWASRR